MVLGIKTYFLLLLKRDLDNQGYLSECSMIYVNLENTFASILIVRTSK